MVERVYYIGGGANRMEINGDVYERGCNYKIKRRVVGYYRELGEKPNETGGADKGSGETY